MSKSLGILMGIMTRFDKVDVSGMATRIHSRIPAILAGENFVQTEVTLDTDLHVQEIAGALKTLR